MRGTVRRRIQSLPNTSHVVLASKITTRVMTDPRGQLEVYCKARPLVQRQLPNYHLAEARIDKRLPQSVSQPRQKKRVITDPRGELEEYCEARPLARRPFTVYLVRHGECPENTEDGSRQKEALVCYHISAHLPKIDKRLPQKHLKTFPKQATRRPQK